MKDYASMSDFEINKRVADIAMNGTWHVRPSHPDNDTGGWLYGSNGIQTYPFLTTAITQRTHGLLSQKTGLALSTLMIMSGDVVAMGIKALFGQ